MSSGGASPVSPGGGGGTRGQRIWLALAATCSLLPYCLYRVPSSDMWWLLAQGRWIWEQGRLPLEDVFSFTAAGHAWHNDQWLSALLFFGVERLGGLLFLHIWKAFWLCLTFALLLDTGLALAHRAEPDQAQPWPLLPLVGLLCLWLSQKEYFFDVRAYLLTYFLMAVWWRWLLLWAEPTPPPSRMRVVALVGTGWLWANLHAGVLVGLGLLTLAWLGGHPGLTSRLKMPGLILLTFLATLVNPSGWGLHLHVVRLMGSDWGKYLNEWQPIWVTPGTFGAYPAYLLVTLGMLIWLRPPRWLAVCLAGVGLLSLTGWRHILLFCWLSIPVWCVWLALFSRGRWTLKGPWLPGGLLTVFLLRAVYFLPQLSPEQLSLVNLYFPRFAADFLEQNRLEPRLFHHYAWGGYLQWRLAPRYQVCIDGRAAQVYPLDAYLAYLKAAGALTTRSKGRSGAREELLRYLDERQVDTVMLSTVPGGEAGRDLLEGNPDWPIIYEDDFCCIFQRRSTGPANYSYPDSPRRLVEQAPSSAEAEALIGRALQMDPEYPRAYFVRGALRLQKDDPRGVQDLERALSLDRSFPNAHFNLAVFFRGRDPLRAYQELQAELQVNPGNGAAKQMLAELKRAAAKN